MNGTPTFGEPWGDRDEGGSGVVSWIGSSSPVRLPDQRGSTLRAVVAISVAVSVVVIVTSN